MPAVKRVPVVGKIGLSTVLWTKLGVTLLIVRVARLCPMQQRVRRGTGCAPMTSGSM